MKKLGLIVAPLISVCLLVNCNSKPEPPTPPVDVTHKFTFAGIGCTVNGEIDYNHDVYEADKNVQYTIVPERDYRLPTPEEIETNVTVTGASISIYDNGLITIDEMKNDITVTVTAVYVGEPKDNYTVHLDADGGSVDGPVILTVPHDSTIEEAPKLKAREGYDLSGVLWWYPVSGGQPAKFTFGEPGVGTPVTKDLFLHAKWGKMITNKVTFVETSAKTTEQDVEYGKRAAFYAPEQTGFVFDGWYDADPETSPSEAHLFNFETAIKAATTIYAKWVPIVVTKTCKVTFAVDDCKIFYKDRVLSENKIDIEVPSGLNPYYVKFTLKADEDTYLKPGDVTFNVSTEYYFNKNNGDLIFNLAADVTVSGTCDIYKSLEESSWDNIALLSERGEADEAYYVGEEKTVIVSGLEHKVRIIGFDHDLLEESTETAGITFEFATVISDENGNAKTSYWNREEGISVTNYNFSYSTLYNFINRTVVDLLPYDLENVIKKVDKLVDTSTDDGESYSPTSFSTFLFPLSRIEWNEIGDEGTAYEYYLHDARKLKKDVNGRVCNYWSRSPVTEYITTPDYKFYAWHIATSGYRNADHINCQYGVAPCFCV